MVEWSEGERWLGAGPAADTAGCSRLMSEEDTGTLTRLAMRDVRHEFVADLGRVCDPSVLLTACGRRHFRC